MAEPGPYSLLAELDKVKDKAKPPVHLWHPESVKDIDMTIEKDGTWTYLGGPIHRHRLAHLFSTVLRREDDGNYYLVTPVEKCRIRVADAPFVAVLVDVEGKGVDQRLEFTTNMADKFSLNAEHPLRVSVDAATGEPSPYVLVRQRLEARLTRSVYYHLAELVVEHHGRLGVWSCGEFFPMDGD